jgi:hypothetical protein
MKKAMRSAANKAQIDSVAALPEDQINIVDIPEAPPENWLHAKRPGLYRPIKRPVTRCDTR